MSLYKFLQSISIEQLQQLSAKFVHTIYGPLENPTRCGIVADSWVNCVYHSEQGIYNINREKIKNIKNLVIKATWMIWVQDELERSNANGEYLPPYLEHTYLMVIENSNICYILQGMEGKYNCRIMGIDKENLLSQLEFIQTFNRQMHLDVGQFNRNFEYFHLDEKVNYVGMTMVSGYPYNLDNINVDFKL